MDHPVQQVHVSKNHAISVRCPQCEKTHHGNVKHLKGQKHQITSRCSCDTVFRFRLNFRQYFRKPTQLPVQIQPMGHSRPLPSPATLLDLSLGGAKIKTVHAIQFSPGDKLRLTFTLDDRRATQVCREITVRAITQRQYINGEFSEPACDTLQKQIGFYLMP